MLRMSDCASIFPMVEGSAPIPSCSVLWDLMRSTTWEAIIRSILLPGLSGIWARGVLEPSTT